MKRPTVWYNEAGDQLEVQIKDAINCEIGDWVDHGLTLMRDQDTKEIVGYHITGVIKKWPEAIKATLKQLDDNPLTNEEWVKSLRYMADVGFANVLVPEERPWGNYRIIEHHESYKIKLITVKPNCRLSLQRHAKRDELWQVIAGNGTFTCGDSLDSLHDFPVNITYPNNIVMISKYQWHRIKAGAEGLQFIEVQTGTYFGEDDIERADDDYGRISNK